MCLTYSARVFAHTLGFPVAYWAKKVTSSQHFYNILSKLAFISFLNKVESSSGLKIFIGCKIFE